MCLAGWKTVSAGIPFPAVQKDPCEERTARDSVPRSAAYRRKSAAGGRGGLQNHSAVPWAQPGFHYIEYLSSRLDPWGRGGGEFYGAAAEMISESLLELLLEQRFRGKTKWGKKLEKHPKPFGLGCFSWCARRDLNPHVRSEH